jgi:hypothetical protein
MLQETPSLRIIVAFPTNSPLHQFPLTKNDRKQLLCVSRVRFGADVPSANVASAASPQRELASCSSSRSPSAHSRSGRRPSPACLQAERARPLWPPNRGRLPIYPDTHRYSDRLDGMPASHASMSGGGVSSPPARTHAFPFSHAGNRYL